MSTTDTHDVFPFFELAPELRNAIYDATLVDRKEFRSHPRQPNLQATGLAVTQLLLVSHRMHEEYAARANVNSRLSVLDHRDLEGATIALPTYAREYRFVAIHLACFCDLGGPDELKLLKSWVKQIVKQLPKLEVLDVHLKLSDVVKVEDVVEDLEKRAWTGLHKLQRIIIWDSDPPQEALERENEQVAYSPHNVWYRLVAKWDATTKHFKMIDGGCSAQH